MLKIAIAEDETSAQTALKEYLDRWQAENGQPVQAVFFESGSQLLENIPQGLQLALLDIQMPGLSGMETAHRLRGTLPELEIVFITSLTGSMRWKATRSLHWIIWSNRSAIRGFAAALSVPAAGSANRQSTS